MRFGNKVGNRPNRLDHPLLTSPDRALIEKVAAAHGGKVEPWPGGEDQWMTEVVELSVLVPVSPEPSTSWWERWSGGGCLRRCDGYRDTINGEPCDCDKGPEQRACKATTRFIVLLPETGDARWRVETKSIHAALEVPDALAAATGDPTGEVIPGVLSVEQRNGRKGKVPVPVVVLDKDGPIKIDESGALSPVEADQLDANEQRAESVASQVEPVSPGSGLISSAQRKRMFAIAKASGISNDDIKDVVLGITGQSSTAAIPKALYDEVIAAIETAAVTGVAEALFAPDRPEDRA